MCVSPKVPSTPSPYGVNPTGATPFMLAAATTMLESCMLWRRPRPTPIFLLQRIVDASDVAVGWVRNRLRTGVLKTSTTAILAAVKAAVEAGADLNAANKRGQTALHLAASKGKNTIIQYLVDKGANLNAKDNKKTDST